MITVGDILMKGFYAKTLAKKSLEMGLHSSGFKRISEPFHQQRNIKLLTAFWSGIQSIIRLLGRLLGALISWYSVLQ